MNSIVIGVLGDLINNYIHEELQQTNAMTPLDAISDMKTILLSLLGKSLAQIRLNLL